MGTRDRWTAMAGQKNDQRRKLPSGRLIARLARGSQATYDRHVCFLVLVVRDKSLAFLNPILRLSSLKASELLLRYQAWGVEELPFFNGRIGEPKGGHLQKII